MVLTVIDELNELASKLYEPFLEEYFCRTDDIQFVDKELSDEEIVENLLQYQIFNKNEIKEVLEEAKKEKDYYPDFSKDNNYDKFSVIYEIIFNKIKPVCDYGVILNEIIYYMRKKQPSLENYFYEKYGYYNYFNSDFYGLSNTSNQKSLKENKFKILFLSYLNCILLYNYNSDHKIDYSEIDFSKMKISDDIKNRYIKTKYKSIQHSFNKLKSSERNLFKVAQSIKKLELQLNRAQKQTEFIVNILPSRIENLKKQYLISYKEYLDLKKQTQEEMYNKLFEINDLSNNTNLNYSLSEFIINHIRNSLAHGYVNFPKDINYNNIYETEICFLDYDKNNKTIKTFEGSIKIGELLDILCNGNVLNALFNNSKIK